METVTIEGQERVRLYSPLKRPYGADQFGYGNKVSTSYKVHYKGRWRRVYCTICSNIGSCFIVVNRKNVYVH